MKNLIYLICLIVIGGCCTQKYVELKTIEGEAYGTILAESFNGNLGMIKINQKDTNGKMTTDATPIFLYEKDGFEHGTNVKFNVKYIKVNNKYIGYAIELEKIDSLAITSFSLLNKTDINYHGAFHHRDLKHRRGHVDTKSISLVSINNKRYKKAKLNNKWSIFEATFDPNGCSNPDSIFYYHENEEKIINDTLTVLVINEIDCTHELIHSN